MRITKATILFLLPLLLPVLLPVLLPAAIAAFLALASCKGENKPEDTIGLLDTGLLFPYPSIHLMREDTASATGWRVDIPAGLLPVSESGTPMPIDRFNRLDGFSPSTPMLVLFEGIIIDPGTLPAQGRIAGSTGEDGAVQLIDLETGERSPILAETDMHPNAVALGRQTLVIRPQKILDWQSHYAVVLTKAIRDTAGAPIPVPRNFAALVAGEDIPPSLVDSQSHYRELFERLGELGIGMEGVLLAWDFWTGSRDATLATIDYVMQKTTEDIPADPGFEPQYETMESRSLDSDLDPAVDPMIWRHVELTFSMATYVRPDGTFELDASGLPLPQGRDDFTLLIHLPPSIHDAQAGTVPVIIFGHGMLGAPHDYLTRGGDGLHALEASNRYGAIYAAPEFRGMCWRDQIDAATAATDFGKFNTITDDLHMGIASFAAAARLFKTRFKDAPFLQAPDGSGSLVDPSRIYYFGISLGGHEGGVVTAVEPTLGYGVLQVGGCPWTLMLERSSNWFDYDVIITTWVRDPVDRQVLYAVSQMLWDPVDPAPHYEALRQKSILIQESIGDAQVPNIATEFWARSIGIPLVQPSTTHPPFMEEAAAPLGPGGSGLFQYNGMAWPECGAMPPEVNLPAEDNCAHRLISESEAQYQQIEAFFQDGSEGTIIQPPVCGTSACAPQPR